MKDTIILSMPVAMEELRRLVSDGFGDMAFTSLINIRPGQSNPGMEIVDLQLRERVRTLTYKLVGRGEAL